MDRVAIFISHYNIGNSPSIINLVEFLSERYRVDLFLRFVGLKNINLFKKNVNIIEMGRKFFPGYLKGRFRAYTTLYKAHISFDPHGFAFCKELFPESKPIYYSLELYMKEDHFGLYYPKHIMEKERAEINKINGLIIQSSEKERLFRNDYNLAPEVPSLLLPVTYKGSSIKDKSDAVRAKYGIPEDKKIALHLGGIAEWHSCIDIAKVFSTLKGWILFFQGYPEKEYLDKLKSVISANNITNVVISEEVYESIDDVDKVVMGCDLGIAWYNDISIGFRTAGKSSGKIAAYLRFGLPVIAKKYPSTIDAIEKTDCGICVESFEEIPDAVSRIEKDYTVYSKNALDEYDKTYWFERYKKKIVELVECGKPN